MTKAACAWHKWRETRSNAGTIMHCVSLLTAEKNTTGDVCWCATREPDTVDGAWTQCVHGFLICSYVPLCKCVYSCVWWENVTVQKNNNIKTELFNLFMDFYQNNPFFLRLSLQEAEGIGTRSYMEKWDYVRQEIWNAAEVPIMKAAQWQHCQWRLSGSSSANICDMKDSWTVRGLSSTYTEAKGQTCLCICFVYVLQMTEGALCCQ